MSLLSIVISAALSGAPAQGPAPETFAGPSGRGTLPAWTYAPDPAGGGETRGYPAGDFTGRSVGVPNVANPATPGSPQAKAAYRGGVGWYRTRVRVRAGTYALRFESVASLARVYVDGRLAATHQRAYDPFEVRRHLGGGSHVVVVRADWRSPAALSKVGLHRTWFNWGGIDREVTLRRLGDSEITGAAVTTRVLDGGSGAVIAITARVRNRLGRRRAVEPLARLRAPDGTTGLFALGSATLGPGEARTLTRQVQISSPQLWSPGHGNLYRLDVGVPFEGSYRARVGLREIAVRRGVITINGRRTRLRGASLQEDAPGHGDALTPADMDASVAQLRRIGATATRAQHPLAPALLERLDAAGIAVWQQIGPVDSPGQFLSGQSPQLLSRAQQDVRDDLQSNRLHPSIVAWSVGCEVAGNGAPGQATFVDGAARELHAADPGRLVGVDIWTDHVPASPGPLYANLDAVGVTSYLGWYEHPFDSRAQVAAALRGRVSTLRRTFPAKAVLVAELGAEGTPANPPAQRGGTGYQARLLGGQLATLRRVGGLSGAFVWLLRDFQVNPAFTGGSIARIDRSIRFTNGLNGKGLFAYDGRPKRAVAAVARQLRAFGS